MTEEKDANGGAWSRVPTWDGSPQTWRSFRKDMSWWLAGLDIESTKKYNLAARQWYLKLNKSFLAAGWERTVCDHACWMLWSDDHTRLEGIVISHVDDLLLGGNKRAQDSLMAIGANLGFGSVEFDDFVFCGKRIRMRPNGEVELSMVEYHSNLRPVTIKEISFDPGVPNDLGAPYFCLLASEIQ